MTYVLDTNACVGLMKKKSRRLAERFHQCHVRGIALSSITLAELEYGVCHSMYPAHNGELLIIFLAGFRVLAFGAQAAAEYGMIRAHLARQGTPIGAMDMLIAAHARSEGLIVVSNNTREFCRVPGLAVEDWTA